MGKRRTVIENVLKIIDGLQIENLGLKIKATHTLFDPDQRIRDLPLFAVASEPENLIVALSGAPAPDLMTSTSIRKS